MDRGGKANFLPSHIGSASGKLLGHRGLLFSSLRLAAQTLPLPLAETVQDYGRGLLPSQGTTQPHAGLPKALFPVPNSQTPRGLVSRLVPLVPHSPSIPLSTLEPQAPLLLSLLSAFLPVRLTPDVLDLPSDNTDLGIPLLAWCLPLHS